MKLGSLFDGSGGFPLAGVINGMKPVWASEIEPYPLKVTAARFPNMIQLGDVTKINGAAIEPVDVVTFGSPCQDLSVAGKQAGIHDGERSNLFFEAIRIIKEMREHDRRTGMADEHLRPRFAVWENVPGAFSSNKGADFQAVLQALCEVTDTYVSVPFPEKGKWQKAGCIVGDGYSVAWRVYDAQFWGVPQRRKRIYLIADFGSERAGEILFERTGMRGRFEARGAHGQGIAADSQGGTREYNREGIDFDLYNFAVSGDKTVTFAANSGQSAGHSVPTVGVPVDGADGGRGLDAVTVYGIDLAITTGGNCTAQGSCVYENIQATLKASGVHAVAYSFDSLASNSMKQPEACNRYIVRRLTPVECARLQGFPDWWEDGVEGSDSARYKMWGNGIALPCAVDVLGRIANATQNT